MTINSKKLLSAFLNVWTVVQQWHAPPFYISLQATQTVACWLCRLWYCELIGHTEDSLIAQYMSLASYSADDIFTEL